MRTYIYVLNLMLFGLAGCQNKNQHINNTDTVINLTATSNVTLGGTVTDYDGNLYKAIKIGTQIWMAENLRVTHYNNGDAITNIPDDKKWRNYTTGAWCYYNNTITYDSIYGLLYNWHAVTDVRKLAPRGWHVPTDAEWQILIKHLGGDAVAGSKLKAIKTGLAGAVDNTATNESKFNALPAGIRNNNGMFDNKGFLGAWWTTTSEQDVDFAINYVIITSSLAIKQNTDDRICGLSVRCIKD